MLNILKKIEKKIVAMIIQKNIILMIIEVLKLLIRKKGVSFLTHCILICFFQ